LFWCKGDGVVQEVATSIPGSNLAETMSSTRASLSC